MRKPKAKIDFTRYTDSGLEEQAHKIIISMTGNANFISPSPTLAELNAATNNYQEALVKVASGVHVYKELKDQKRAELEAIIKNLARYVQMQSGGDAAIMMSSGFKISKDPSPTGPLPKPSGFKISALGKGEIKLELKKLYGAKSYRFEYKIANDEKWLIKISTHTKLLLTGLESGKEYFFRVVPLGTNEIKEYSDEIRSFVL